MIFITLKNITTKFFSLTFFKIINFYLLLRNIADTKVIQPCFAFTEIDFEYCKKQKLIVKSLKIVFIK
ncbi:MAG TPA: hypothetical protein DDW90_09765 [Cyanobacteria bacterium UBA9971]|nr:hypothetical protein [Cyanobacteria bacterium UBA9971]